MTEMWLDFACKQTPRNLGQMVARAQEASEYQQCADTRISFSTLHQPQSTTTISRSFGRLGSSNGLWYSLPSHHGIFMSILSLVRDVKHVALRVITAAPPSPQTPRASLILTYGSIPVPRTVQPWGYGREESAAW